MPGGASTEEGDYGEGPSTRHAGAERPGTAAEATVDAVSDDAEMAMTVGEVSTLLGVSVRALHHWDESGLVHPLPAQCRRLPALQ